jgi:hypothetical protein
MDPEEIALRLGNDFPTGDINNDALDEIRRRLRRTRLSRGVISYSDLVSGIVFRHGTFWGGEEHLVDTSNWTGLDRQMIGGVLAKLSVESVRAHGYLAGVMVVSKDTLEPSGVFYDWLYDCGVLTHSSQEAREELWISHLTLAHNHRG